MIEFYRNVLLPLVLVIGAIILVAFLSLKLTLMDERVMRERTERFWTACAAIGGRVEYEYYLGVLVPKSCLEHRR